MQKEEMIALLLCIVTTIQMVTPTKYVVGNNDVISFITPIAGAEHKQKCHVRNKWDAQVTDYKMICYQCNDEQRSIIIYSDSKPVDAVNVKSCSHLDVAGSITVVPVKNTNNYDIEYDKVGGGCVRVSYPGVRTEEKCPMSYERHIPASKGLNFNGWKLLDKPWTTGVVRRMLNTNYQTESCKPIMSWKSKELTMKCFKCSDDFVVKIYNNGATMAVASVGTCRSPELENSIDNVDYQPTTTVIQYKLYTNKCDRVIYTSVNDIFRSSRIDCQQDQATICDVAKSCNNAWKIANNA